MGEISKRILSLSDQSSWRPPPVAQMHSSSCIPLPTCRNYRRPNIFTIGSVHRVFCGSRTLPVKRYPNSKLFGRSVVSYVRYMLDPFTFLDIELLAGVSKLPTRPNLFEGDMLVKGYLTYCAFHCPLRFSSFPPLKLQHREIGYALILWERFCWATIH